jgi:superfamily II DNA/RNA helicase
LDRLFGRLSPTAHYCRTVERDIGINRNRPSSGPGVIMHRSSFAQLGLPAALVRALAAAGLEEPFPVQEAAIPDALDGRDVAGRAPTGSGKTLAFGLPLLARVGRAGRNRPRALILAPTRELAEQIRSDLAPLAKAAGRSIMAVYGGVGYGPQKNALRRGTDVLVATPGRLEDLIQQGAADLAEVDIAVVDEADRMADMGFLPAVKRILDRTASDRQTLLFSATLDGDIAELSRRYQRDPIRHESAPATRDLPEARHHFWLVDNAERARHAADLVTTTGRSIVFTRTRRGADRLTKRLAHLGVGAVALHGGRSQNQRTRALRDFSEGRAQALVATDVAARGIHVEAVASVVHFDPPADSKDYVHRSGRTARAGAPGSVVSLVSGDQRRAVTRMQRQLGLDAPLSAPRLEDLPIGAGDPPAPPTPRSVDRRTGKPQRKQPVAKGAGKDTVSVYVANLPWTTTSDGLRALFAPHGTVSQTTIITDRRSGRSKGFGFVEMPAGEARNAIAALHGSDLAGRDLTVRLAKPRRYGT